jgi:hypothetical protein
MSTEEQRAKWREAWHRRTKKRTKKAKAYKAWKAEYKAAWQAANPEKNVAYVQAFRERWGRWPAQAEKKSAASAMTGRSNKPARASRSRDTGGKVTKKAVKPKPKAKPKNQRRDKPTRRL